MIQDKKIIHNTSMLYIMNIAKMIFPLITLPYLTRVLSVPGYGVVSYVKAIMQYMQLMVDFGFLLSGTKDIVMVQGEKDKIDHEVGNIFLARLLLVGIAFLGLCLITPLIQILRENMLFTMLSFVVVALTVFLMDFYFRGIEKMEVITIRFVVMKGIAAALTFVFVHNDNDILWIPILDIIGSLVAVALVWVELRKFNVHLKFDGLSASLKKLKDSAVYFFSDMATTAFNALNTVLIGIYINKTDVAFWSLCMQLIGAVQSLYTPITSGIYPQMMRSRNRRLIQKTMRIFMPIVCIGCVFTFFVAKYALLIVGGEKYVAAENTLRLLIPVLFFSFPSMLYGWPTLGAINKQRETTMTTIISAVFQVVMILGLIFFNRFNLASIAIARCFTEAALFALRFGFYRKNISEFA